VKQVVRMVAVMAMLAVGAVPALGSDGAVAEAGTEGSAGAGALAPLVWRPCPPATTGKAAGAAGTAGLGGAVAAREPAGVECATLDVPLDYRAPSGRSIKLALNRVKAKNGAGYLGPLLVNPGGPGASGRSLAQYVATMLPQKLSERYDVIGFDPRGVGKSEPAVHCVDAAEYYRAPRPDAVPRTKSDEAVLLGRAKQYADACRDRWGWLLPHLTTEDSVRDMDAIRAALGQPKISYLGYSYGTYLGAVYATLFPDRVKRLVLDSTVDPGGIWYDANLAQDKAFDQRHHAFLGWVARNNAVYKLGATVKQTRFAWFALRDRLRTRPADGLVGPSELDDTFTVAGYSDRIWPDLAQAWSRYVRQNDAKALAAVWDKHGKQEADDENGYAIYLGVQCTDAQWPTDWATWRSDMTRLNREAPFMTWPNAWFNAPCAFWPVPGGTPVDIHASGKLPPILMIQSRGDAATPYQGALNMRKHFPSARMVVESGGNHGVSLAGNQCVDRHLITYLTNGSVPHQNATCDALAAPRATAHMSAGGPVGHERLTEVITR
jgi:pimeloyl-ACP methyl ester carboxylesterase